MIQAIKAVIALDQTALAVRKLRSLNPVNSAVLLCYLCWNFVHQKGC